MNIILRKIFSFILVFVLAFPCTVVASPEVNLEGEPHTEATVSSDESDDFEINKIEEDHVPGEVLVVYEDNVTERQEDAVKDEYDLYEETGADSLAENTGENGFDTVHKLEVTDDTSIEEMIAQLEDDPRVKYVEPNYILQTDNAITLDDPQAINQWHLDKINAYEAWEALGDSGAKIKVAVLDTQVQVDHPDLEANLVDAYNPLAEDGKPEPGERHGTHVAGIIAAVANNGKGVAGITYNKVNVIPVTTGKGSAVSGVGIVVGYQYAVNQGARVVNMSFSGGLDTIFESVLEHGKKMGVVNVASAGNDGVEIKNYPADHDSVISVINTTSEDKKADSSTYGDGKNISAPGTSIMSTLQNSTYGTAGGTSMASPVVAGVAALMLSANPDLTPDEVASILYETAEDLGDEGYDPYFGHGRVDAERAVKYALYGEAPVTSVSFDDPDIELKISETKTMVANIFPVGAANTNKGKWRSDNISVAEVSHKGVITAKRPGEANITFSYGDYSASVKVTVTREIIAPTIKSIGKHNHHTYKVNYSSILGVDGYEIYRYVATSGNDGPDNSYICVGVTDDTSYLDDTITRQNIRTYYRVKAFVETDEGKIYSPMSISYSSSNLPNIPAPANFDANSKGADIKLSWDKVSGATSYTIEYSTNGSSYFTFPTINDGDVLSYLHVAPEANVTYYYRIYASLSSMTHTTSDVITCTVDGSLPKITGLKARATDYQTVELSWEEVIDADGYEIDRRKGLDGVYETIDTINNPSTASYNDNGLLAGYTYYYRVRAFKMVSESKVYGGDSAAVNAKPMFDAPQNVEVEPISTSSVKITWGLVPGATRYIVQQSREVYVGGGFTTLTIYKELVAGTEYIETDLSSTTKYTFRVSTGSAELYDEHQDTSKAINGVVSEEVSITPHEVYLDLESITLPSPISLKAGNYMQMSIIASPAKAQVTDAIWSSDNEAIATVDDGGIVTGVSAGNTTITCNVGGKSATATVNVSEPQVRAPQNIEVKSNGFTSVKISWKPVSGADKYEIYRTEAPNRAADKIVTVGADVSEVDCVAAYGSNYYYLIIAYKGSTFSDPSVLVRCLVDGATPENIEAKIADTFIDLSWEAVQGAAGYTVMRSTNATNGFKSVGTVTDLSYQDDKTTLALGTTYYYKIKAYGPGSIMGSAYHDSVKVYGALSEEVPVKVIAIPDAPTGVNAVSNSYNSIKLSWNKVLGTGVSGYDIYRSTTSNGEYNKVGSVTGADALTFTDTGLVTGTTYHYRVSIHGVVEGQQVVVKMSSAVNAAPNLSGTVGVSATLSGLNIKISWSTVAGADGYEIERSGSSSAGFSTISNTVTGLTYTDVSPGVNKVHYYRVRAYRMVNSQKVYSGYSSIVQETIKVDTGKDDTGKDDTGKDDTGKDDTKAEADRAAASAVIAKINSIGVVNKASKAVIDEAQKEYDRLTPEQKALVTNYSVLKVAQQEYARVLKLVSVKSVKTVSKVYVVAGKSIKLPASVQPFNATNKGVTWKSSNKKIATVTSNGTVKTKKGAAGKKVKITATSKDGKKKAICTVYVVKSKTALKSMKINQTKGLKLAIGKTKQIKTTLKAKKATGIIPTFASSKKSVATIDKMGVITAHKAGKTKITVKAGKYKRTFTLTVVKKT